MTQMLMSAHTMEIQKCKIETQERFWDWSKIYHDLFTNMTDKVDSIAFAEIYPGINKNDDSRFQTFVFLECSTFVPENVDKKYRHSETITAIDNNLQGDK